MTARNLLYVAGLKGCLLVVTFGATCALAAAESSTATATVRVSLTIPERIDTTPLAAMRHCDDVREHRVDQDIRSAAPIDLECSEPPRRRTRSATDQSGNRVILIAPI